MINEYLLLLSLFILYTHSNNNPPGVHSYLCSFIHPPKYAAITQVFSIQMRWAKQTMTTTTNIDFVWCPTRRLMVRPEEFSLPNGTALSRCFTCITHSTPSNFMGKKIFSIIPIAGGYKAQSLHILSIRPNKSHSKEEKKMEIFLSKRYGPNENSISVKSSSYSFRPKIHGSR